jgi:glutamate dehydrogenase
MDHGLINTVEERNKRLKKLADEEVALVLQNNFTQNWALAYLKNLSQTEVSYIVDFIDMLTAEHLWSQTGENLHDRQIIQDCLKNNKPIPNPLLAIIHSLSKIYLAKIFNIKKNTQLYNEELEKYFPSSLEKFKYLYLKHPLKNEIIKTRVVNKIMDSIGFPGLVKCLKYLNLHVNEAVQHYFISRKVLSIEGLKLSRHLPDLELRSFSDSSFDLMLAVKNRIEKAIYRYMEMAVLFDLDLSEDLNIHLLPELNENYLSKLNVDFKNEKITKEESEELLQLSNVEFRFAVEHLTPKKGKPDYINIFDLYCNHGIIQLKKELYRIKPENKWQIQAQSGLKKLFWAGLMNCDIKSLEESTRKIRLNDEILKLKKENNLNLSTLNGIISYIFQ